MAYFVELPRAAIDESAWDLAVKAVRWGTAELDLPAQPAIRWFRDGAPWMKSRLDGFEHETRHPSGLMGTAVHDPKAVWLRDGMSPSEQLVTVLHELRHLFTGAPTTGSPERVEQYEAEAERWGRKAAREFESRPKAYKSADFRTPTVHVRKAEHVYGFEDVPNLTQRTRFGSELYGESRPLVMGDDMGSLTGKRVGTVSSLGAMDDDERMFFASQLALNHQYRQHIARLVEQGALEAKALVLDHHIRRDASGRLADLPVAAVALTAAAA